MNTYVILLRGINVGGKNTVSMAGLRKCLEEQGFSNVSTYIASGNVILKSDTHANDVKTQIEGLLSDNFKLDDGFIKADKISHVFDDDKSVVGVEIHSGRNRIIRRIFEKVGYHVLKLDRVYFGGLTKKGLSRGKWRYLAPREVGFLKMLKG